MIQHLLPQQVLVRAVSSEVQCIDESPTVNSLITRTGYGSTVTIKVNGNTPLPRFLRACSLLMERRTDPLRILQLQSDQATQI
jgi:hypothetical protein